MKFKIKSCITIIISMTLSLCLVGCWNSRELNSLAFMIAMGIDKTEDGILLTVQVLNPRAIASQKTVNEPTVVVYTEEGKDTIELIRKIITQSSRKINATHLQTVIFGEEFAKEGVSDVLDFLSREHQVRTDMYFAVAEGLTANSVLNNLTKLDTNPSVKLYSSIKASDEIWAGTKSVKIISLINCIISDGKNAVITGVHLAGDSQADDTLDKLKEIKADPIKIMDLAVFQDDKLVGWLDEEESKGYNYIIGHVSSTMGYVEDKNTGKITTEVTNAKSKRIVSLVNGKPVITVNIDVKANIETASAVLDITKAENLKIVEKLAEDKIGGMVNRTIKKAQKDLHSDVFGFGEVIHRAYPKLWATLKENWDREFTDLPVHVNVTVKIEKTGTISKSFFLKDQK